MEGEQGEGHRAPRDDLAMQGPRPRLGSVAAFPFARSCKAAADLLRYLQVSIGNYGLKSIPRLLGHWKVAWHNAEENSSRVLERLRLSRRDGDLPLREKCSAWDQLL